jgi:hypothetical protein
VGLDGVDRHVELVGDLTVRHGRDEVAEDHPLPPAQRVDGVFDGGVADGDGVRPGDEELIEVGSARPAATDVAHRVEHRGARLGDEEHEALGLGQVEHEGGGLVGVVARCAGHGRLPDGHRQPLPGRALIGAELLQCDRRPVEPAARRVESRGCEQL